MPHRLLRALTFANVCSFLALTIALGTGAAYAANAVRSRDIVNGQVKASDIGRKAVTSPKIKAGAVDGTKVLSDSLTAGNLAADSVAGSELAADSVGGSELLANSVTTSDIADGTVSMDDIDGVARSGSISVGAISDGRCTTITASVPGAEPGDVAVLTTNGSIANGMTMSAQRALTDTVHVKVCNLSGATSAAITDLPVRIITFH
jgi:hypothetical protein